eukprot:comp21521_c0_seq1/m.29912 comp21521_c0_seq1/g.29912  ORF comp21521_c0_seq1/g.29912 comp21521_c0_seq1/m.29912 type:complete len:310 (+) comp21521_c0_seq1:1049-1978(+)
MLGVTFVPSWFFVVFSVLGVTFSGFLLSAFHVCTAPVSPSPWAIVCFRLESFISSDFPSFVCSIVPEVPSIFSFDITISSLVSSSTSPLISLFWLTSPSSIFAISFSVFSLLSATFTLFPFISSTHTFTFFISTPSPVSVSAPSFPSFVSIILSVNSTFSFTLPTFSTVGVTTSVTFPVFFLRLNPPSSIISSPPPSSPTSILSRFTPFISLSSSSLELSNTIRDNLRTFLAVDFTHSPSSSSFSSPSSLPLSFPFFSFNSFPSKSSFLSSVSLSPSLLLFSITLFLNFLFLGVFFKGSSSDVCSLLFS